MPEPVGGAARRPRPWVASGVLTRHLAQGTGHARAAVQRWRGASAPAGPFPGDSPGDDADGAGLLARAEAALAAGELSEAAHLAGQAGLAGRLLARFAEGERAVLEPTTGRRPTPVRRAPWLADTAAGTHRPLHLVTLALPEEVSGYTVRTQGILAAQRAAGHDAHAVTRLGYPVSQGHLRTAELVEVDGVPYHHLLRRAPLRADAALRRDVAATVALVERLRPTVLHAHSTHLNAQVALAVRDLLGIPVVYELRGMVEETRRERQGGRRSEQWHATRAIEDHCLRSADAVATIAATMRDDPANGVLARGVPPERVLLSPNAVSDRLLDAEPVEPPSAGSTDRIVVGVVGTLNHYEGLDVLIEAVRRLQAAAERGEGPRVEVRLVGDGPARDDLERSAEGLPITFVGRVPPEQVAAAYQALDVYVVPRLDLPVTRLVPPLKPVEAMAMGLPVVASDLPPLAELVTPDRGVLVRPGDADSLADALTALALDPGGRRTLGAAGGEHVRSERTWARTAARYADLYDRLRPAATPRQQPGPPNQGAPA